MATPTLIRIDKENAVFAKGYLSPDNMKKLEQKQVIPVSAGFCEGLIPLNAKELKGRASVSFLDKKQEA